MSDRRNHGPLKGPLTRLTPRESGGLQTLIRYANVVRERLVWVLLCIAIFCSLGLLYYVATPQIYEAEAEIMISAVLRDDRLLVSEPVLADAILQLKKKRPAALDGVPEDEQTEYIRSRLVIRKPGGRPEILQLRYRSPDPREAVAVLQSILTAFVAYRGFDNGFPDGKGPGGREKTTAKLMNEILRGRLRIDRQMAEKRAELFREMRRLGMDPNDPRFDSFVNEAKTTGNTVPQNSPPAREPKRLFPTIDPNPEKKPFGKSREEIQRLQVLMYESRLLNMLRSLLDDLAETAAGEKKKNAKVEIIQKPITPEQPISPRKISHVLVFSMILGTAFGLGLVFLLEALDDRIHSHQEFCRSVTAPIVGTFPQLSLSTESAAAHPADGLAPFSPENAARFQSLRMAIDCSLAGKRTIAVSSVNSSTDVVVLAESLAATYAANGGHVLLIQTDFLHHHSPASTSPASTPTSSPSTSTLAAGDGLAEILTATRPVAEMLSESVGAVTVDHHRIDILRSGTPTRSSTETLAGNRLTDLLAVVSAEYDFVIIEATPVLSCVDAALVGRLAEGILLVVRPAKNTRSQLVRVDETLQMYGCRVNGIIINADGLRKNWHQGRMGTNTTGIAANGVASSETGDISVPRLHRAAMSEETDSRKVEEETDHSSRSAA